MTRHLHVILRTSMDTSVRPWKRIIDIPRDQLILKCTQSLVNTINDFDDKELEIDLTVLDDHSEPANLQKLEKVLDTSNRSYKLTNLTKQGVNHSALYQFQLAHDSPDMVYIVEDDYFHAPTALKQMFNAWFYFRHKVDLLDVAVYPYDSTHLYEPENNGNPDPTKIHIVNGHYWRTTTKTANTVLMHSVTIKKYWPLFETLAKEFPYVAEDETINRMYNNGVTIGGPVCLFSPMPSLAVHVSYNMPTIIPTDFIDWVSCFYNLEVKC